MAHGNSRTRADALGVCPCTAPLCARLFCARAERSSVPPRSPPARARWVPQVRGAGALPLLPRLRLPGLPGMVGRWRQALSGASAPGGEG